MVSSCIQVVPSDLAVDIFPFMSLPTEIRIMIYDATLPEEVHHITSRSTGISPCIRAFMTIKEIRKEFLSRLFSRSHFIWHDVGLDLSGANKRHAPFKRYAFPFITTITIHFQSPASAVQSRSPPEHCDDLLRWMRWRSVRSHIHPWHLKHLKLVMPHILPRRGRWLFQQQDMISVTQFYSYQTDFIHPCLLTRAHNVSGLNSLEIISPCYPEPEAAEKFFDRCASKGLLGMIGYQEESGGKISWLCLKNNQILPRDP